MQIKSNQLADALEKALQPPPILLLGDEEMLVQSARESVISHYKSYGFRRVILDIDKASAWPSCSLFDAQSLFEDKVLFDVRLSSGAHLNAGEAWLVRALTADSSQRVVLSCPALSTSVQNGALMKQKLQEAWIVNLWPLNAHEIPLMVEQIAKRYDCRLSNTQISMVSDITEGSVYDIQACCQRLVARFGPGIKLRDQDITPYLSHESTFNSFELLDALWKDDASIEPFIEHLNDAVYIPLVALLSHQFQRLASIKSDLERGDSLPSLFQLHHVWPKQQPSYRAALNKLSLNTIESAVMRLSYLEAAFKQGQESYARRDLIQLLWSFKLPHTIPYQLDLETVT